MHIRHHLSFFVFSVFFYANPYRMIYAERIRIDSFTLQLSSSEFPCNQVLHLKVLATHKKVIVYHISLENVGTLVSCTRYFSSALDLLVQSQHLTRYSNLCRPYFTLLSKRFMRVPPPPPPPPPNFETLCWSLEDWVWVFPKSWKREFETWNGNSEASRQDWFQLSLEKFKPSNWNFRLRTTFSVFVSEQRTTN